MDYFCLPPDSSAAPGCDVIFIDVNLESSYISYCHPKGEGSFFTDTLLELKVLGGFWCFLETFLCELISGLDENERVSWGSCVLMWGD